nr:MAG TPA: hypothetical protein [Caudoviricetes sp.]
MRNTKSSTSHQISQMLQSTCDFLHSAFSVLEVA